MKTCKTCGIYTSQAKERCINCRLKDQDYQDWCNLVKSFGDNTYKEKAPE